MSGFAGTKDLAEKMVGFDELAPGLFGCTAEGDPNSGVVVGDDSVLVVDVIARFRTVIDRPILHTMMTYDFALRVLGASGVQGSRGDRVRLRAEHDRGARAAGHGQRDRALACCCGGTSTWRCGSRVSRPGGCWRRCMRGWRMQRSAGSTRPLLLPANHTGKDAVVLDAIAGARATEDGQ